MTTIRAVIHNRRIDVPAPSDLLDGTEVVLTIGPSVPENGTLSPEESARLPAAALPRLEPFDFMTEDEQSDDPEAIQSWLVDLQSIPPLPEHPAKEAERQAWEEQMRRFNLAAVRNQFAEGTP